MQETTRKIPELLLPAGTPEKLKVAYKYGADACYVGAAGFSMRPDQASFTLERIAQACDLAHSMDKKLYVGINSMYFENDMPQLADWLKQSHGINVDALIVSDPGAFELVKQHRPDVELHISTQLSTANSIAVEFWRKNGADRVILARECSLADITKIAAQSKIPIESFVHGAMCTAVSGRCLLSAHLSGKSGSRGQCKHTCRWDWQLVESKRPGMTVPVYETGRETIFLGSTDLCLIEHIPELVKSGLASLKVEGRMKSEYYVAAVARVYRKALDTYAQMGDDYKYDPALLAELETVNHQPYEKGFAFGYPEDPAELQSPGRVKGTHFFVGLVQNSTPGKATVDTKRPIATGEKIEWIAPGFERGTVTIKQVRDEFGKHRQWSHVGRIVEFEYEEQIALPECAIFRRETELPDIPKEL